MSDTQQTPPPTGTETVADTPSILDEVWAETKSRQLSSKAETVRAGMEYLLHELLKPERDAGKAVDVDLDVVESLIADIDRRIGTFMDGILHHEEFQQLESAWRGLHHLVSNTDHRQNIFVDVLHLPRRELAQDLSRKADPTRSDFYHHVYVGHLGQYGGEPYGAIIGNYEFNHEPKDVALLGSVAAVAAMAHAPFVAAASPKMFGLEKFGDFNVNINELSKQFVGENYAAWRSFRDGNEDARYVGLTAPRFMLRHPYSEKTADLETFNYVEKADSDAKDYLWGNAAFAFGGNLSKAFAKSGWCFDIIGPRSGGAVDAMPQHVYEKDGRTHTMVATELLLSDRREQELSEQGFIPLVMRKDTDEAAFFSANSVKKPGFFGKTPEGRDQEAGDRLGTRLPYLMMISRLAHGIKVQQRMALGGWGNRGDIEDQLQRWLKQYVSDMESPNPKTRAQKPLRRASITVKDFPGHAGWYTVDMKVMPHLKYEGADFTLSLVSRLDFDRKN